MDARESLLDVLKKEIFCKAKGCGKPGVKKCERCGGVAYCSEECQRRHWPEHKDWCEKLRRISAALYTASQDEKREVERVQREIDSDEEDAENFATFAKQNCDCVGMPKRKQPPEEEKEDLPPGPPPAQRIRTIREDAAREVAAVPAEQIDPAVYAREMARLATPEGRWAMARQLFLGYTKGEGVLRDLAANVFEQILRQYVLAPIVRGTIAVDSRQSIVENPAAGERELVFMHTIPTSVRASKLSWRQLKAALGLSAIADGPDVIAAVTEHILVLWESDEAYVAYFRADGSAEHVERLRVGDEPGIPSVAYAPKEQKFVVACGTSASILDAAPGAAKKLVTVFSPLLGNFGDAFAFRDDMLCFKNAETGEYFVFGPSNGWAAPVYLFVATACAPHSSGNLLLSFKHEGVTRPRVMKVHYFSPETNAFTAARYELGDAEFSGGNRVVTLAAGLLLSEQSRGRDGTLRVLVVAPPPRPPPAGAPVQVLRYTKLRGVPAGRTRLDARDIYSMTKGITVMDGVAAICPPEIEYFHGASKSTFGIGWASRDPRGEPRLAITNIRFPRRMAESRTVSFEIFALSEVQRTAAIVMHYEEAGGEHLRVVYSANVDTGQQTRKGIVLRYVNEVFRVLKEL